jgi:hypothetical protein
VPNRSSDILQLINGKVNLFGEVNRNCGEDMAFQELSTTQWSGQAQFLVEQGIHIDGITFASR